MKTPYVNVQLLTSINNMITQYSSSQICPYDNQDCEDSEKLDLEPGDRDRFSPIISSYWIDRCVFCYLTDIEDILATSSDYDELAYVWSEWRRVAARPMRTDYETYVEYSNKAAEANNLADMGELWVEPYESGDRKEFQTELERILNQTKPFYDNLHAYARMKLREKFGSAKIDNDRPPIPASLLGNRRSSLLIDQLIHSYYEKETCGLNRGRTSTTCLHHTRTLLRLTWRIRWTNWFALKMTSKLAWMTHSRSFPMQGWDATKMFEVAEEFYTSLDLQAMPTCYGPDSMIVKPANRTVVCHASAWDFSDKKDFRWEMQKKNVVIF